MDNTQLSRLKEQEKNNSKHEVPVEEAVGKYLADSVHRNGILLLSAGVQVSEEFARSLKNKYIHDVVVRDYDPKMPKADEDKGSSDVSAQSGNGVLERKLDNIDHDFSRGYDLQSRKELKNELEEDIKKGNGSKARSLVAAIKEEYKSSWLDYRKAAAQYGDDIKFVGKLLSLVSVGKKVDFDMVEKTLSASFETYFMEGFNPTNPTFPEPLIEMEALRELHPDYNFAHSLRVAIKSGVMAYIANLYHGIANKRKKEKIGLKYDVSAAMMAGALHDSGTLQPDIEPLMRLEKLNRLESETYRRHPHYAFMMLKRYKQAKPGIDMAALEHHECFDGTGYPNEKKGKDITPLGALVGVAEHYDSILYSAFDGIIDLSQEEFIEGVVKASYGNQNIFYMKFERSGVNYENGDIIKDPFYAPMIAAFRSNPEYVKILRS